MSDNDKDLSALSEDELNASVFVNGEKLGFLLSESSLPEDIKEDLISLTEEMDGEELEKFIDILEANYLNEKTADIDKELEEKLRALVECYGREDKEYEENVLKKIADIEAAK